MIRIKSIHIEEFRGIRSLKLAVGGKNFGICGPNGTGKSGIVDAIEFCLTGSITRLSGEGQGELSVKGHAPHVDQRGSPDRAKVTLSVSIPSLGKDATVSRSVKAPGKLLIAPDDPAITAVMEELQSHPEFALSRREITKYVIARPAKRSTDVQNLLRLDQVDTLRKSLASYANRCGKDSDEAERARSSAERELKIALDSRELDRVQLLTQVNLQRGILGLQSIAELTRVTSFKEGTAGQGEQRRKPAIVKAVAQKDLEALSASIDSGETIDVKAERETALKVLEKLVEDDKALALARHHGFIATGLDLVTADTCPLCDHPWDAEVLRAHLKAKLLSAEAVDQMLREVRKALNAVIGALEERASGIRKVLGYASALDPVVPSDELGRHLQTLEAANRHLIDFLNDHSRTAGAISTLKQAWWAVPADVVARILETARAAGLLPDGSAEQRAVEILTILQERYDRLLKTTAIAKSAEARSIKARRLYEGYNSASNRVLEGIYDAVTVEFTSFYKAINDDEGTFVAELKPGPAKLNLNVDFYGRGNFPPGAYHSEGHQDGMGLCLYLALMKHTLGDKFTFAVLDDVLMSVDTGHRREVCRLLKTEFPNTQFILTTHDRVWLQFMRSEGLVQQSQFFGGWTVDAGPRVWDDTDIWTQIYSALAAGEIPRAAALLRRYLEYVASVLADNLRAKVEYRGDSNYDLGDLLSPVTSRWVDRLEKGIKVAGRWGHDEAKAALEARRDEAKALIACLNTEQRAINKSVHFNDWENFTDAEFRKVVQAFKDLLDHVRCSNSKCGGYPYLLPRKGSSEQMRCSCGAINVNLREK